MPSGLTRVRCSQATLARRSGAARYALRFGGGAEQGHSPLPARAMAVAADEVRVLVDEQHGGPPSWRDEPGSLAREQADPAPQRVARADVGVCLAPEGTGTRRTDRPRAAADADPSQPGRSKAPRERPRVQRGDGRFDGVVGEPRCHVMPPARTSADGERRYRAACGESGCVRRVLGGEAPRSDLHRRLLVGMIRGEPGVNRALLSGSRWSPEGPEASPEPCRR